MNYEDYLQFCETQRQREVFEAIISTGSQIKAAKAIGMHKRNVERIVALIRTRAQLRGFSPEHDATHPVMPTEMLRGRSTLYDGNGAARLTWVKTSSSDEARLEALRVAAEALREELPRFKPVRAPTRMVHEHLLNQFTITDFHLGMLAWAEEAGEDFDLDIAESLLLNWFAAAIKAAPPAKTAVFAQLGDFLHFDGLEALTPASKHVLDVDTRFQKVVRVAIRVIRQIMRMLLETHEQVHVIMADANHDPAGGVWLREWLADAYSEDPRVTVDNSAGTYYALEFGKTLLMFHHGHKRPPKNIDTVLVAKFRESYGRTQHHYAHMGHLHHDLVLETNLMHVEQHETLATQDAYAARAGYMSKRSAKVITYHSEFGEVGRTIIRPEMLS